MATQPTPFLTPEEYLDIERRADFRSEYYQGQMHAMSGASRIHNIVALNIASELRASLRGRFCRAYAADLRVQVSATGLYTYPDVVIACQEEQYSDSAQDTLLNPTVIIEVLSESTEAYDRGKKFAHYRTLPSLQEYVLVAQDRPEVVVHRRQENGQWLLTIATQLSDTIELVSINSRLKLSDVYEDVTFPS